MKNTFSEVKIFQVKPDKLDEFEKLIGTVAAEQGRRPGCAGRRYRKRFYVFDDIEGSPRELTKIVKCVKYFSYWEFDTVENYTAATHWFFENHAKGLMKRLIMPFDINCGNTVY